jgi:hypothetical protein
MFSGYTLNVSEKSGSTNTRPGDVIYAKAIKYDDIGLLVGTGAVIIPPMYKTLIIDLRTSIREENEFISNDILLAWDDIIRDPYRKITRSTGLAAHSIDYDHFLYFPIVSYH